MADFTESHHFPDRSRKGRPLANFVVGALLGVVATFLAPQTYVAEVSLLFPTINSNTLKQASKTLKLDASGVDWNKTNSTSDSQLIEAATTVLKSRAAVNSSLKEAKVVLSPTITVLQGDPVEAFRNNNISISEDGSAFKLKIAYSRAESARALCQGLLDYYTTFVHEHRLTNTARTRLQLEEKLVRVDKRLSVLEHKLVSAGGSRFQLGGDGIIRDPKLIREIWKNRILESGASGRITDTMREIRKQASQNNGTESEEDIGEDWRTRWASTTLEGPNKNESDLPRTARRSELPSRLELERVYEETLLLYHSGLLQYDFLSMWEGLENFDFEIVDPISVHREASTDRLFRWALIGGLIVSLGGLLSRRT